MSPTHPRGPGPDDDAFASFAKELGLGDLIGDHEVAEELRKLHRATGGGYGNDFDEEEFSPSSMGYPVEEEFDSPLQGGHGEDEGREEALPGEASLDDYLAQGGDINERGELVNYDPDRFGLLGLFGDPEEARWELVGIGPDALDDMTFEASLEIGLGSEVYVTDEGTMLFAGEDISGRDLSGLHFESANFTKAIFVARGASASETSFEGAELRGARFAGCRMPGVDFNQASILPLLLDRNTTVYSTFKNAQADGANFMEAELDEVILSGGSFREALFMQATLSRADLSEGNFTRANFFQANLSKARLKGANLSGADLTGADLRGADLSDVITTAETIFDNVIIDTQTALPTNAPQRLHDKIERLRREEQKQQPVQVSQPGEEQVTAYDALRDLVSRLKTERAQREQKSSS